MITDAVRARKNKASLSEEAPRGPVCMHLSSASHSLNEETQKTHPHKRNEMGRGVVLIMAQERNTFLPM